MHPQFVFYCQIVVEQQFAKYIVNKVGRITAVMLVSGKSSQVVWVIKMVKLVCKSGSRIPGSTVAALAGSEQSGRLQSQIE